MSKPRGNEPTFELRTDLYQLTGVDFTQIDGLDVLSIQQIISETGLDMGKWPTVKHFTSWLCLSPYRDISGGRTLRTAQNPQPGYQSLSPRCPELEPQQKCPWSVLPADARQIRPCQSYCGNGS